MSGRMAVCLASVLLAGAPIHAGLHQAVRARDQQAIDQILQGADSRQVNAVERDGVTALHVAAAMGQGDVLSKLIQAGASVDAATGSGFTPLHWAVSRDQDEVVAALLAAGADPSPVAGGGITPLHWAASRGNTNSSALLISAGADIRVRSTAGLSPLYTALRQDAANPVAVLLARAEVFREIREGRLPDAPSSRLDAPDVADLDRPGPDAVPVTLSPPERGKVLTVSIGMGEELEFVWIERLGIWVGKFEITNAQFRRFNPRHDSGSYEGLSLNAPEYPVARITWHEAAAFCDWLTEAFAGRIPDDMQFRLPTNREWTIMAGCGDGRRYPWGSEWPPRYGNYSDTTAREQLSEWRGIEGYNDGFAVSAPVEHSGMNEWGIYGLGGNVWEWTLDWSDATERFKSRRGASWDFDTRESLAISWIGFDRPDARYHNIGFRVIVAPR